MASCRGANCNAEIIFAVTPEGEMQPFDRVPNPEGNRLLLGRGPNRPPMAVPVPAELSFTPQIAACRYMPHHATCADVSQFRAKGAKSG